MPSNQEGAKINETVKKQPIPHSNFNLSRRFGITTKFGYNTPFFSEEVVPDDGPIKIQPNCSTRSLSLKAPMYGDIKKHVSFYQVPLQAILPFNWQKVVRQSDRGSDVQGGTSATGIVPAIDGVNTVVSNFLGRLITPLETDFDKLVDIINDFYGDDPQYDGKELLEALLHFVIRWEMFFSHGNLLSCLGVHYGSSIWFEEGNIHHSFDQVCEVILSFVSKCSFGLQARGGSPSVRVSTGVVHVRRCLEFMRNNEGPFTVTGNYVPSTLDKSDLEFWNWTLDNRISEENSEPLNYGRCCAYQIANAHYFTNSKIDYIYSAELYRQYVSSLIRNYEGDYYSFTYNGISTLYDYLSGRYMSSFITGFSELTFDDSNLWIDIMPYFNAIFGFNRSLRYMDYFVGARPRNYAIGDLSVGVADNKVNVVDITKNIVRQRFLNAVARTKQEIEDYARDVMGTNMAYDWHDPKYLFSFDVNLFTQEIENTGEAQVTDPNSITSVLHGSNGNLEFSFSIDRYSFIVGIEYYDFERFYFTTQERNTMAVDRFDMFIPELQYVGDQELRVSELLAGSDKYSGFGFQLRDMNFKQKYPQCAGGFVDYLPGWLFTYDPSEVTQEDADEMFISPEFIRSHSTELDGFYLSLTNMNLAGYFHFIELWDIKVSATRPMAYAPEIL